MKELTQDEATSLLGEGFHTALRKAGDSLHATRAYQAIEDMDDDEWGYVLDFVVDGLKYGGISLVRKEEE